MKLSQRQWLILGAIALLLLSILIFAPANNRLNHGSTYGRAPTGYRAWYTYMLEQEIPIERWQKPLADLVKSKNESATLLRVYGEPRLPSLSQNERNWVEKGNTLVILGFFKTVTQAPFQTFQDSAVGEVKINTTRRAKDQEAILGDRFGAVVWQEKVGAGKVIWATTPDLGANAYQEVEGNYQFLAELVSQDQQPIWVDEYIHGYKDREIIARESEEDLISYLAKTPILPMIVQIIVVFGVAIWAGNHRLGMPTTLSTPATNNSQAYIKALAEVLQKANSKEFVIFEVGKAEQKRLQKALGLGDTLLDRQALIDVWVQQTGHSVKELEEVLKTGSRHRISETELQKWLNKWQQILEEVEGRK